MSRLYHWVLSWADTPYGAPALFILSVVESSFFPIPPDPLLLALGLSKPKRAFIYAFICTTGSVIGGAIGYMIGLYLIDSVGIMIIEFYGMAEKYDAIQALYQEYNAAVVLVAGISPIPYKVFTIAAGAFKVSFPVFIAASVAGRGFRFFAEGALVYYLGDKVKGIIEKHINLLAWVFSALAVGGFVALKYIF